MDDLFISSFLAVCAACIYLPKKDGANKKGDWRTGRQSKNRRRGRSRMPDPKMGASEPDKAMQRARGRCNGIKAQTHANGCIKLMRPEIDSQMR